jgi:hypothetical protein
VTVDRTFATPTNVVAGGNSYGNAALVTPSDSVALTPAAQALWVGGAGAVALVTLNGQTVTFAGVPAGTTLPVAAQLVKATGTTATGIFGLW